MNNMEIDGEFYVEHLKLVEKIKELEISCKKKIDEHESNTVKALRERDAYIESLSHSSMQRRIEMQQEELHKVETQSAHYRHEAETRAKTEDVQRMTIKRLNEKLAVAVEGLEKISNKMGKAIDDSYNLKFCVESAREALEKIKGEK